MNLILFDDPAHRTDLLPFTFTRPVGRIRVGILTIAEKWEKYFNTTASYLTQNYLQERFPCNPGNDNLLINGCICPDQGLVEKIRSIGKGQGLAQNDTIIAVRPDDASFDAIKTASFTGHPDSFTIIDKPWKIFMENGAQIRSDFSLITAGRKSAPIDDKPTIVYNSRNIFIEEGVTIRAAVLNAENGPIYLGHGSTIMEGASIKGPFGLCDGSTVNMGARMRGDTTLGPSTKAGGEISNSVIFGNSSKVHDGFMGNSVIGEWCNLGADTNTSNMKNNYELVRIWSYAERRFANTGLQFCGLMMGDHSKCGINTMFNTGTVVGVSTNIFGSGFPRTYIPSFSWGGAHGFTDYALEKACETARRAMARRNVVFEEADYKVLMHIFNETKASRKH